ncbi:teichoic acid transporter (plasmid) [Bacillus mycoides]|uniref:teichoic acid transporter n=1 Tax=Bacillus mycoides TaxID=1405 RepID=UPI001C01A95D|nr:teichoic acid transporter [Bacillus mycoides]QWG30989.1 teichoic acid transporter [Bacillus mycoides]
MKAEKILQTIWCLFLEITAMFAGKIKIYNEKKIKNYELIIIQLYNAIFSIFFAIIGSFFVALAVSLFTKNLYSDWYVFFKIFMILNSLMILVNLSSKTLNVPMILMRLIFSLKDKFHSVKSFGLYIGKLYLIVICSIIILYLILLQFFTQYNVENEYSIIYALILSVALSVAGIYSFPVKKGDRDINELIVSPLYIVINIYIGYKTSKANILNNASQGNDDMVGNLLILFIITTFVQVITYLKKLFEMLHQLSEYEKDINNYASNGKKRFAFLKERFKETLIKFNQVVIDLKSIKNAKRKFLLLICFSLFIAIGTIYLSRVIGIGVNYLGEAIVLFKLDKLISKILAYIILFGICLVMIFKLYDFLFLAFKRNKHTKEIKRWEYFSLALLLFGILIMLVMTLVTTVFSIELSSNTPLIAGGFMLASSTILWGIDLTKWLLRKRKVEEKEEIK